MTNVRGRSILGLLAYTKIEHGNARVADLIGGLGSAQRAHFDQRIRRSAWYPYAVFVALLGGIEQRFGQGDPRFVESLGRYTLHRDVRGILAILRVFSSVDALVHRGFGSWGAYLWSRHCSSGEVVLADSGPGFATMGIESFPDIAPAHCRLITGYLAEMGRLVGADKMEMIHTTCVRRGDARCAFRGRWSG